MPLASGGLLLWLHDVTAARRAAQARRDVVANISHELRTPLASIKLLAETLADGAVADAETGREFAVQIQREVDHLAQLVDELLDLSMIESGRDRSWSSSRLPLGGCSKTWPSASVPSPRGGTSRSGASVPEPLPDTERVRAAADPARLSQALLNLAHNAVKYSHRGGEVRLGWDPIDGRRPVLGRR